MGRVGHASFLEKCTGETTLMGLRRESYSDRKGKTAGLFSFQNTPTYILFSLPFISFLPLCHLSSLSLSPCLLPLCLCSVFSTLFLISCLFLHHKKRRFNKVQEYKAVAEESLLRPSLPCYGHCPEGPTMFSA